MKLLLGTQSIEYATIEAAREAFNRNKNIKDIIETPTGYRAILFSTGHVGTQYNGPEIEDPECTGLRGAYEEIHRSIIRGINRCHNLLLE
jgi:hypothetical protein